MDGGGGDGRDCSGGNVELGEGCLNTVSSQ